MTMRYASGLLVVIAAALVISAALPAAYGHLAEEVFKVPSISYEDMELTVRVSVTPHDFATEDIDEVNLKVKIFDLLTGNTLTQVTYRVEVWKNDDLLARSLFYDDDGIHYIEVRPDSNCDAARLYQCVTYDGSEHVGSPGALYAFGIECNDDNLDVCARPAITGPVFDKGGLYNVKIVIEGIGFPEVQLAERLTFDTFVSIVQEQDFLISTAHAGEIPVVVKGHYDSVKNFAFDPSDSSITFDMPFDWDPDHVGLVQVVHEEIQIPSSFAPYSDGTQFKGYINGIEVSRRALINDPFSMEGTNIIHFLVGQSELERINADLGPEHHSNKNMNFRLVPVPAQPALEKTEETGTVTLPDGENPDAGVISYTIVGGSVTSIMPIPDSIMPWASSALSISINAADDGYVTLTIPRTVADSKLPNGMDDIYFVLADRNESVYEESRTDYARTLTIYFVAGVEEIVLIGTLVAAEFDTVEKEEVVPPLKQVRQGVPVQQVSCNGDRVLMLTPSGQPACVFSPPHLLESRGFVFVEAPSRINHEELAEIFDIRVVADPAEIPVTFGYKGSQEALWTDFQSRQDDVIMIEYFKHIYREIDLEHEFTDGKVNSYLGVNLDSILFLFADVTTQGTFNVTIPYLIYPPVTSANIPQVVVFELQGSVVTTDSAVTVYNQTSASQIFSFEVVPGSGDISMLFVHHQPSPTAPDLWNVVAFYTLGWHNEGTCDGNLIFIPRADGTHVCMQPIMLETILVHYEEKSDESAYETIIKKYEKYACPADAPVFLVRYDYSETTCVPHDMVPEQHLWGSWKGDYSLFGHQYDLGW